MTGSFGLDAREVLEDHGLWRARPALRAIWRWPRGRRDGCCCVSRHWAAPLSAVSLPRVDGMCRRTFSLLMGHEMSKARVRV